MNALSPQRRGTVLITAHEGCSASGASPCCCGPGSAALGGVGRFSPSCSLGARRRAARPQGGGPCGPLPSAWNIYAESLNFFCVETRLFSPARLFVHRCASIGMHCGCSSPGHASPISSLRLFQLWPREPSRAASVSLRHSHVAVSPLKIMSRQWVLASL